MRRTNQEIQQIEDNWLLNTEASKKLHMWNDTHCMTTYSIRSNIAYTYFGGAYKKYISKYYSCYDEDYAFKRIASENYTKAYLSNDGIIEDALTRISTSTDRLKYVEDFYDTSTTQPINVDNIKEYMKGLIPLYERAVLNNLLLSLPLGSYNITTYYKVIKGRQTPVTPGITMLSAHLKDIVLKDMKCVDLDMVNSVPIDLAALNKETGFNSPLINEWAENKDALIDIFSETMSKTDAKIQYLSPIFGGRSLSTVTRQLRKDIEQLSHLLSPLPLGSYNNNDETTWAQKIYYHLMVRETECIDFYRKILVKLGHSVYTLTYDGMIISSTINKEDIEYAEMMFELRFGYRKQLKIKRKW